MWDRIEAVKAFRALPERRAAGGQQADPEHPAQSRLRRGWTSRCSSFPEQHDRDLYHALRHASAKAVPQFEKGNYTDYLKSFAVLKGPVDVFFDKVMVMAEDPTVRRKRLNLLYELEFEMNRVADISKLAS